MTRSWPWIRALTTLAALGVVGWRLGAGPFLDGIRSLDPTLLAAAAAIGLVSTACAALRWSTVAGGLGIGIALRPALAAYYRALLVNSVLPGGIVGDVHRGVRHGRAGSAVGLGLRSVCWERLAGQVVQIVLTATVLLLAPSPARSAMPWLLAGAAALALPAIVVLRRRPQGSGAGQGGGAGQRISQVICRDLRHGLLGRRRLPVVILTSTVVVIGHAATLVLAARAVGVPASLTRLVPAVLLVLAAMSIPISLGGWGPREGVAAWVFAAAGWGAAQGVAAATAYGVMALVAALPGVVVLLLDLRTAHHRRMSAPIRPDAASAAAEPARSSGASRG